MVISVEKLIPGVILADDVLGTSSKPIMPRATVLTEQHILFLKKFLIKDVKVEARLQNGTLFIQ